MTDFVSVDCPNCGEAFLTREGAKAAETGYCSPACHVAGEGLG